MRTHAVIMIALWSLLTQALLGSGMQSAVLCIKGGDSCGTEKAVASSCECCCANEVEVVRTTIRLCTPCDDECGDCIEVDLPRETLAAAAPDRLPDAASVDVPIPMQTVFVENAPATGTSAQGAGPPGLAARLTAPVLASTHLLL